MEKKKAIMRKVLSCLVVIAILTSTVPGTVFAMDSSVSATEASSNDNFLEEAHTENNSAENAINTKNNIAIARKTDDYPGTEKGEVLFRGEASIYWFDFWGGINWEGYEVNINQILYDPNNYLQNTPSIWVIQPAWSYPRMDWSVSSGTLVEVYGQYVVVEIDGSIYGEIHLCEPDEEYGTRDYFLRDITQSETYESTGTVTGVPKNPSRAGFYSLDLDDVDYGWNWYGEVYFSKTSNGPQVDNVAVGDAVEICGNRYYYNDGRAIIDLITSDHYLKKKDSEPTQFYIRPACQDVNGNHLNDVSYEFVDYPSYKGTCDYNEYLIAPGFGTYKVKFAKGDLEATVTLESHSKPFAGTVVTLRKKEGSIYATSTPSGANMYLDGTYKGTSPITILNVPVGTHTVKYTKTGYKDCVKTVTVYANQQRNVHCSLEEEKFYVRPACRDVNGNHLDDVSYEFVDYPSYKGTCDYNEYLIAPGFGTYKVKFTKGDLEATVTLESHSKTFAGTVVTLRGEEKKPNLVIESISSSLQNPKIGDKIKFTVKTKNKGDGDADHVFYIYYYINGDKKDSDYVSSLSTGRTKTTYFSWTADKCGDVEVKAWADATDKVDEGSNEWDNTKIETVNVECEKTDLAIIDMTYSPFPCPEMGEDISIKLLVKNEGQSRIRGTHSIFINFIDNASISGMMHSFTAMREGEVILDYYNPYIGTLKLDLSPGETQTIDCGNFKISDEGKCILANTLQAKIAPVEYQDSYPANNIINKTFLMNLGSQYRYACVYHAARLALSTFLDIYITMLQSNPSLQEHYLNGVEAFQNGDLATAASENIRVLYMLSTGQGIDPVLFAKNFVEGILETSECIAKSILFIANFQAWFQHQITPFPLQIFDIESPADIIVTNEVGERVGYINGQTINEMANAEVIINGDKKIVIIYEDGDYNVQLHGTDYGTANYYMLTSSTSKPTKVVGYNNVQIAPTTSATVNTEDYRMSIDYNGDGATDEVRSPDVSEMIEVEEPSGEKGVIDVQISAGEDDGFVARSPELFRNDSTGIMIGTDLKFSSFLRFSNVTIPENATITRAYVTVVPIVTNQAGPQVNISVADGANPSAPISSSDYYARERTASSVSWNASSWYAGESKNSSDISNVIQELVDSYDYPSGAPVLIFLDAEEGVDGRNQCFAAYEHLDYESAKLHVEYESKEEIGVKSGWLHSGYDLDNTRFYPYPSETPVASFDVVWTSPNKGKILTGDINGDDELELISAFEERVCAMDKNGILLWSKNVTTDSGIAGAKVNSLDLDDMDGDGAVEIIVGVSPQKSYVKNQMRILFYKRNGDILKTITTVESKHISSVKCADLNNDGKKEVIVGISAGYILKPRGVYVYDYSTGSEIWHYCIGPTPQTIAIADVTGDASKEIILGTNGPWNGNYDSGISDSECAAICLSSDGKRLWMHKFEKTGFVDAQVAVSDLDGDGRNEIIACSQEHGWHKWDGNWGKIYTLNPDTGEVERVCDVGMPLLYWAGMGIANFDGDGHKEIIVAVKDGSMKVGGIMMFDSCLNPLRDYIIPDSRAMIRAVNDIDGDGKKEVIVCTDDKRLVILDNKLREIWSYKLGAKGNAIVSDLIPGGTNEIIVSADKLYVLSGVPTPMPDLIVSSIHFDPYPAHEGESFVATVTVKNQGDGDAGPHWESLESSYVVRPWQCSGLKTGASKTFTRNLGEPEYPDTFKAYADWGDEVQESNEDNNCLTVFLDVGENTNKPPVNPTLTPDKSSPQPAGTTIKWTASATDPDGDQLYYMLWMEGPATGNSWHIVKAYSTDNTWTWHAASADVGTNSFCIWIRDGHHALIGEKDLEEVYWDYEITA